MAELGIGKAREPERERDWLERARLEIVAGILPVKMWLNPSWALVAVFPFLGLFPAFGHVPPWRIVAAVLPHFVNSLLAAVFFVRYRRDPLDGKGWLRVFTIFQAIVGASWGLMVWLLWVPGNALNHAIIVIPIVAVLWSNGASKRSYWSLHMLGVLPIFCLTLARLLLPADDVSIGLAVVFTLAFLCTLVVGYGAQKQTYRLLRADLANQELTAELRAARDDALRKRYEAEAANASKTTFLANMSHELRTPLNAILGFSEIIANEAFGAVGVPRYADYARDINASGGHLLSIINDILDIAKIESGKMAIDRTYLEPNATIENAIRVLAPRAREKGQHLSVRIAPDARAVFADERAFKQILINLLTNAVKFTQMAGSITVHGLRTAEGGFELVVEDNGPGIEASALDDIFLPFNQVDNRYSRHAGGTGLGLSLVRGLAALHGGKAWIETEFGAGVKAHVYFPSGNAAPTAMTEARLSA